MDKVLLYFGCDKVPGHYLIGGSESSIFGINREVIRGIDKLFALGNTREQGHYQVSTVPPVIIVSWWDYTIDSRPGSNSNLIGYGYDNVEDIFKDAKIKFPSVMNRQPVLTHIKL